MGCDRARGGIPSLRRYDPDQVHRVSNEFRPLSRDGWTLRPSQASPWTLARLPSGSVGVKADRPETSILKIVGPAHFEFQPVMKCGPPAKLAKEPANHGCGGAAGGIGRGVSGWFHSAIW